MRRARIVRIEWDDHALEPNDDFIWEALMDFLGSAYTVSGEPSFEVSVVSPVSQTGSSKKSVIQTPDE